MKYKYYLVLLLSVFILFPASAQRALFKPITPLRVIRTNHFDIIFPQESESSARQLASYADKTYVHVSSLLGIEVRGRIPVTFAPHTDIFNGYYNSAFNHIVLFDTPMDIEWTTFANNLEGLFIHELTHAVSLNSRKPHYRLMHRIFGNWVSPAAGNAPLFMVEGITIGFESLDGFGRANDPRVKQYLRQAIYEGEFLSPFQASGVYDLPIQPRGYYYEYGGLFSAWLKQTYGMEKYAELWQAKGQLLNFSLSVYRSGFYKVFKKTYGIDFLSAWSSFRDSLAIDDLEINSDELIPRQLLFFSKKERYIRSMTARGSNLYYIDRTEKKIGIYNTLTEEMRSINTDSFAYDLDVSADNRFILLSGYRRTEDRASAIVIEHRADNGHRTGRVIRNLYKARYFRDGVIGIRSNLHNTNIVYEHFNGKSEILFRGNEELMFSGPQAIDDEQITFIVSRNGKRELWLYNYTSTELFRMEISAVEEPDVIDTISNGIYWHYMRNLRVSDGKLLFSYNTDDRMYKLAYVNLDTMQAVFSGRDFSGGVFDPVYADDSIYYRGAFVFHDSLMRFPEPVSSLSGTRKDLQLVKLDNKNYEKTGEQPYMPSKKYSGIRYMNPFNYWFPFPLIRGFKSDNGIRLDGGGILSLMADPTGRNQITILAFADIPYQMARIDQFTWQNTSLGFPLSISINDTVEETVNNTYRYTSASLIGSLSWNIGQWGQQAYLGTGYARIANQEEGKNAYQWSESGSGLIIAGGFGIVYRGFAFILNSVSFLNTFEPRIDGVFRTDINTRFPMHLTFFGVYDSREMDIHGESSSYGSQAITNHTLIEYSHPAGMPLLTWLGGCEIAVDLFSIEIQKNISHLYFNRFTGTLALRNQLYDSNGRPQAEGIELNDLRLAQSLRLKLGTTISFFPFVQSPFKIEPYVWFAWKFSNTITGNGDPFAWKFNLGFNALF